MEELTIFGIPLGHPPTSHPPTIPFPYPAERDRLAPYRRTTVQLLAEHDNEVSGWEALTILIDVAISASDLYYADRVSQLMELTTFWMSESAI
jgi:hypothetical protein